MCTISRFSVNGHQSPIYVQRQGWSLGKVTVWRTLTGWTKALTCPSELIICSLQLLTAQKQQVSHFDLNSLNNYYEALQWRSTGAHSRVIIHKEITKYAVESQELICNESHLTNIEFWLWSLDSVGSTHTLLSCRCSLGLVHWGLTGQL